MLMDKKYLALFDLDGTLFDTSEVNYYAYKDALKPFGVSLEKEYFLTECNGKHYKEFLPIIMGTDEYIEEVHKLKKDKYVQNLRKAIENKHLFAMAKAMCSTYHLAIVTTASRKNTMDILKYFGYESLFEHMVTQENITRAKPDPEGFEIAMRYFNASPANTIIFEDSDVGIQAAKATGASVLIVSQLWYDTRR